MTDSSRLDFPCWQPTARGSGPNTRGNTNFQLVGFHGFTAVAELKLPSLRRVPRRAVSFHGFTAVAELKRKNDSSPDDTPPPDFHGFTAVAELKRPPPDPHHRPHHIFHGFTAVAELKRGAC